MTVPCSGSSTSTQSRKDVKLGRTVGHPVSKKEVSSSILRELSRKEFFRRSIPWVSRSKKEFFQHVQFSERVEQRSFLGATEFLTVGRKSHSNEKCLPFGDLK